MASATAVVLLGGCAFVDGDHGVRVGYQLASWSESEVPRSRLEGAVAPGRPRLVEEALERSLAGFDEEGVEALAAGRRSGDVMVAFAYHRCQGVQLYADPWDDQMWFQIPPERERTVCAWSPYSVEVWAVPEEDLPAPLAEVELVTAKDR